MAAMPIARCRMERCNVFIAIHCNGALPWDSMHSSHCVILVEEAIVCAAKRGNDGKTDSPHPSSRGCASRLWKPAWGTCACSWSNLVHLLIWLRHLELHECECSLRVPRVCADPGSSRGHHCCCWRGIPPHNPRPVSPHHSRIAFPPHHRRHGTQSYPCAAKQRSLHHLCSRNVCSPGHESHAHGTYVQQFRVTGPVPWWRCPLRRVRSDSHNQPVRLHE